MNILVLAPQSVYVERGTPIAVRHLVYTLSGEGHHVELFSFGGGELVNGPRIRHTQIGKALGLVPPGFSTRKLCLDVLLFFKAFLHLLRKDVHVIHAVEEASLIAAILAPLFKVKYIYDMDSSLPMQLIEKWPRLEKYQHVMERVENFQFRRADYVLPVCELLAERVSANSNTPHKVLSDVPLDMIELKDTTLLEYPSAARNEKTFMYVGNLESYQGIDLMLLAFAELLSTRTDVRFVVIGGDQEHIDLYKVLAKELSIEDKVQFLGPRPTEHIYSYLDLADVLVSPRTKGINTPMKIYSYMASGTPIVATALPTHTQVLDSEVAFLAKPSPTDLSVAYLSAIQPEANLIGYAAKERVKQKHSIVAFRKSLAEAYCEVAKLSSGS